MGSGHHRRVDAHRDVRSPVDQLGDGEQFDDVAEPGRVGDVHRPDAGDPLPVDVVTDDVAAEGQPGQDRRLGGRASPSTSAVGSRSASPSAWASASASA